MPDSAAQPAALRPSDVDVDALVAALPAEAAERVGQLVREREALFVLHETLLAAERAAGLESKLRHFVQALTTLGFARAVLTLRDEGMHPTLLVAAGLSAEDERTLREGPSEGDAWRRRLAGLERFRVSQSFYVPGGDPFAEREFGGALRSSLEAGEADPLWSPRDALIVPLRGADGRLLATLILDDPTDRRRPTVARIRVVELFAQQMSWVVEQEHLGGLAGRRAVRLQRLHEAGARLGTSLDEREVARELAEQARDMLGAEAAVVAFLDIDRGRVAWALAVLGAGDARPAGPASLDPQGVLARAARSTRSVRVPSAEGADVLALAYGVGAPEARAPGTVLAVPLMLGARLVAVLALHARRTANWSDEDEDMLGTFAAQATAAITNARLYAESERERRQSEALSEIARAVSESLRLGEVLPLILRHAAALLRGAGASLSLRDGEELEIVSAVGDAEPQLGMRLPIRESMSGRVLERLVPMYSNDTPHDATVFRPAQRAANVRRAVSVPLITGRGSLGVLSVINRGEDFTEHDARVLQRLADSVAVAVVNAQLFEEVSAKNALAERYRHAVEAASDAIVITDRERRILFTNPAARHLFALDTESVVGRQLDEFAVPETPEHAGALERALGGASERYDATLRRPYGERFSVSVSAAPLREAGDDVSGLVVSLRDVTAERRARDAVAHSEARYRNLFETATDAIYTLDPRGSFTSVNHAVSGLTGLPRAELLGRSILPFLAPEQVPGVRKNFRTALAGQPTYYECHLVRPDGGRRLLSVTNTPIRQGREVVGVLGIARDVTEERARARELARSEARYTRLVESASDAIFTVDEAGTFTSVNRAMERALGRRRAELLGVHVMELVDPNDRETMGAILDATLRGQRQRGELRYAGHRSTRRTGSIITAPIVEEGRVTGALGVVRDVTDEKRMGDQLLQQEKLAAIGQLVSGVAHELNNPLAGVMAFAQLLLASSDVEGDDRFAAETIHQESKRAAKIVSNLLTFARQHPPERRVADLNRVVEDTLELRRYALRMEQVELEVALDGDLPLTWADPFQLQQVVLNLITNAEQALADWQGPRRVRVATSHTDDHLVLTVADSGPGIAQESIDRIFNPFYTTKPVGQGTGLGLSISDGIVREHGGSIRVESLPGEGATFVVELPVVTPEATPVARRDSAAHVRGGGGAAAAPTGVSLLVVDDEPAIRSAVSTFLRGEGHVVDTAGSGGEALERLSRRRYDAVLLDLRMPDTSGDALFHELRTRDPSLARRVVFVTGDVADDSPSREAIAATGLPVLLKPFTFADLAEALRAVGVDDARTS